MKRALSGITPSSANGLHLGNYLGMVKPAVEFQNEAECFYFIANIHSLNTVFEPKQVEQNTMNIFIEFLALGINNEKTTFYIESDIPSITYLQSILNNAVTISELKRMHAYKDKLQGDISPDQIGLGLFSYPVLMAADILLFDIDIVPVGEDQAQHVEICREIGKTFNNRYGNILKVPEQYFRPGSAKVPGIYGDRKMSKSLGNDLPIFAPETEIKKRVTLIKTDPARIHATDPGDPSKNVIFTYFELMEFNQEKIVDMKERYKKGSIPDREIKEIFYDFFMEYFSDFRSKKEKLLQDKTHLHDLRVEGAKRANPIADKTIERVRKAVGI